MRKSLAIAATLIAASFMIIAESCSKKSSTPKRLTIDGAEEYEVVSESITYWSNGQIHQRYGYSSEKCSSEDLVKSLAYEMDGSLFYDWQLYKNGLSRTIRYRNGVMTKCTVHNENNGLDVESTEYYENGEKKKFSEFFEDCVKITEYNEDGSVQSERTESK